MATQLTLSQRSALANNFRFQQRLKSALDKTANYWSGAPYDGNGAPRALALGDYNHAFQKRKRAVKLILGGLQMAPWASMFVAQFNDNADPDMLENPANPFHAETNQLSDTAILNSSVLSTVYDAIAGIESADANESIEW